MVRREDDAERRASFDRAAAVERARMVVPAAGDYIFVQPVSGGIIVERPAVDRPFAEFSGDGGVIRAAAIQAKRKT